ncbi:hypothetical protein Hanom_Chr00s028592g01768171 [Helianthus anomalus]
MEFNYIVTFSVMMCLDNLYVSSRCFRHRLGCDSGDEEGDDGEGGEGDGGDGEGGDGEGIAHTGDRSQVAAEELRGDCPYVRRSVRQRVMPPPGVEERLVQVESDVAAVRGDLAAVRGDLAAVRENVRWMVDAIVAMHYAAHLPPRASAAAAPPPPP